MCKYTRAWACLVGASERLSRSLPGKRRRPVCTVRRSGLTDRLFDASRFRSGVRGGWLLGLFGGFWVEALLRGGRRVPLCADAFEQGARGLVVGILIDQFALEGPLEDGLAKAG